MVLYVIHHILSNNEDDAGAVYLYDWKVAYGYPNAGETGSKTVLINDVAKSSPSGLAWAIAIEIENPDIMGTTATNHRGYAYLIAYKTPSNFTGYSNVYGHYHHQSIKFLGSISISIQGSSVSISPSIYYTEANNNPNVQFLIR